MSNESVAASTVRGAAEGVAKRLSFLDRYLTVWIFLAMAVGVITIGRGLEQLRAGDCGRRRYLREPAD